MANHLPLLSCVVMLGFATGIASAQTSSVMERQKLIELRNKQVGQPGFLELPRAPGHNFDVGGWVTVANLDLRDDDHSKITPDTTKNLFLEDTRLWFAGDVSDRLGYYVRVRHQDYVISTAPGTAPTDLSQQEGIKLDQAFVDWKLGDRIDARLGRQFVALGRGLALAEDLDGASFELSDDNWRHRAFAGQSLRRDPGIDTSILGYDQGLARHDFFFEESKLRAKSGNEFWLFAMIQNDDSRTSMPLLALLDFHYQSHYVGFGSQGRIDPKLNYYVEAIGEGGTTLMGAPPFRREPISACALMSGLEYYPSWMWKPELRLDFAYGSGDRERGSVTDTFGGGNPSATGDHNFLYFGAYDGGLALSPRLSNLVVARVGYQAKPLPKKNAELPELAFGGTVSLYWKDEISGAISDTLATLPSSDVGDGFDLFVAYRPLSDLSTLLQYGRFEPGKAYPVASRDATSRVFLTATQSF